MACESLQGPANAGPAALSGRARAAARLHRLAARPLDSPHVAVDTEASHE